MAKNKETAIGDCVYGLLWWIPGSMKWTPEVFEKINEELSDLYEAGVMAGKEGKL